MALDDIIRGAVATAHNLTTSLQPTVTHYAWIGQDAFGAKSYAPPVILPALVEQRLREHKTGSGTTVMTRAKVSFLKIVPPNGAAGRTEPIDPKDKIVLPDGTSGPIVDVEGLIDPDSLCPYLPEVWIGAGSAGTG